MSFYFTFFSQSDLGHTYTNIDTPDVVKNIHETRKSGRNYERVM